MRRLKPPQCHLSDNAFKEQSAKFESVGSDGAAIRYINGCAINHMASSNNTQNPTRYSAREGSLNIHEAFFLHPNGPRGELIATIKGILSCSGERTPNKHQQRNEYTVNADSWTFSARRSYVKSQQRRCTACVPLSGTVASGFRRLRRNGELGLFARPTHCISSIIIPALS